MKTIIEYKESKNLTADWKSLVEFDSREKAELYLIFVSDDIVTRIVEESKTISMAADGDGGVSARSMIQSADDDDYSECCKALGREEAAKMTKKQKHFPVHPYNQNVLCVKRDKRTWDKFKKSYEAAGGWPGHATMDWALDAGDYLMSCGCSARAAGKIVADKQNVRRAFVDFVVTGQSGRVIFEVPGVVKAVSGRPYKASACAD